MAVVNEVVTEFGYQGSTKPLDKYNAALGDSIKLLTASAAAVGAAAAATYAFVASTTEALDPMIQLSRQTGVAVEAMQELSFAASVTGSSTEAVLSSMDGLSEKIGEAAQQGSEQFARLGISVRDANGEVKAADQVLQEVGERFRGMNLSLDEQRSFAQQLGIDPSLIQLLNKTSEEMSGLRERARELGTVNEEQADAAVRLNDSVTTLKFGMSGLRNSIAVGLAPQIENLTKGFIEFLEENRELISKGISKVLEFVQTLTAAIGRLLPVIGLAVVAFGIWKVATLGLGTVLATVFSPVYVITAAIVALLVVIDDLMVAFKGGESVIADFFQEFLGVDIVPILQEIVDFATAMFDRIAAVAKRVFDVIANIVKGFVSIFKGEWDEAGNYFGAALDVILSLFSDFIDTAITAGTYLAEAMWKGLSAIGGWFVDMFNNAFGGIGGMAVDAVSDLANQFIEGFKEVFSFITAGFDKVGEIAADVAGFFGFGGDDEDSQEKQDKDKREQEERDRRKEALERRKAEIKQRSSEGYYNPARAAGGIRGARQESSVVNEINRTNETEKQRQITEEMNVIDSEIKRVNEESRVSEISRINERNIENERNFVDVPQQMRLQPGGTANTSNVSNSVSQDVRISIRSDNPEAAGRSVNNALQSQLSDAETQFNVGGR